MCLYRTLTPSLCILFLIFLPTLTFADFQAGKAAFDRGDYATALKEWQPLAEQGDAEAQYNLAEMYEKGQGVPKDHAESNRLHRLAAEQGHVGAQRLLGLIYLYGLEGTPRNLTEGAHWYRLAAEQGDAYSQYQLGNLYKEGGGVPQDFTEAVRWYRKAARRGNNSAQLRHGLGRQNGIHWLT